MALERRGCVAETRDLLVCHDASGIGTRHRRDAASGERDTAARAGERVRIPSHSNASANHRCCQEQPALRSR